MMTKTRWLRHDFQTALCGGIKRAVLDAVAVGTGHENFTRHNRLDCHDHIFTVPGTAEAYVRQIVNLEMSYIILFQTGPCPGSA